MAQYDWQALHFEFLSGDYLSVRDFLKQRLNVEVPSGLMLEKTTGWAPEKKQLIENTKAKLLKEAQKKLEDRYRPDMKQLGEMHKGIIMLSQGKLQKMLENCYDATTKRFTAEPDMIDLRELWKIIKVELQEPTEINREYSVDDEEQELIRKLIDENI